MAMKVFNVGDVLGAADLNTYCVNTGFAIKVANTNRSNNATPANDPDLQLPITAAASYRMVLMVQFSSPSTPGFTFGFQGSGTCHLYGRWLSWNPAGSPQYVQPNGSLATGSYDGGVTADLPATVNLPGTSGTATNWIQVEGILTVGASSGTLNWKWSQNTSNASATTVYAGSSLCLWRVA